MSLDESVRQEITNTLESNEVVLFMKGNRRSPQCGFSATVVGILDSMLGDYHTVDVLSEPEVRDGIKTFSSWPTIPQLYVKGEFVGGCDIIQEMMGSGELYETLGLEPVEVVQPNIIVTESAAGALTQAAAEHGGGGRELHLTRLASIEHGAHQHHRHGGRSGAGPSRPWAERPASMPSGRGRTPQPPCAAGAPRARVVAQLLLVELASSAGEAVAAGAAAEQLVAMTAAGATAAAAEARIAAHAE